jgi:Alpha/beta hydrolase of unknown function (DUF900)
MLFGGFFVFGKLILCFLRFDKMGSLNPIQLFFFFLIFSKMNAATPAFYFLEIHPDGVSGWGNLVLPEKKGAVEYQVFAEGELKFWENLQKDLENNQNQPKNDVLFFIHGMNGNREPYFSQVLRQMQTDYLEREDCSIQRIICLTWNPERRGYKTISREAAPLIAAVFSTIFPKIKVFEETTARQLNSKFHLFGNSMAARIFSLAFQKIEVENFKKPIFATMIFSAPDVEKADFPERPGFQKMPKIAAKTTFFSIKKTMHFDMRRGLMVRCLDAKAQN